jgi:hypothetical protein
VIKHIIVEELRPGCREEFDEVAHGLYAVLLDRGWHRYRRWVVGPGETTEPGLFNAGILGTAGSVDAEVVVFEGDYADRTELDEALAAMRNDRDVVRHIIRAIALSDPSKSRSYVLESWGPDPTRLVSASGAASAS